VNVDVYTDGRRVRGEVPLERAVEASAAPKSFAWIGLADPTEEEFDSVRREFGLHELAVEDAVQAQQRPKVEVYGDSLFVVLRSVGYEGDELDFAEVQAFVGEKFIVTVRHGEAPIDEVHDRLDARPDGVRQGPSAVLYAIVDRVLDTYRPVIEQLDAEVADLEAQLFEPGSHNLSERIYRLNRRVLELYSAIRRLDDPVGRLATGPDPVIPDAMRPYFRDEHDHVVRGISVTENLRELLESVLSTNISQASYRQNDDVRKISAWAAIIAAPTLISGIYGMNFEHMPELTWTFGYPLAIGLMIVVCVVLYWRFRRAGWL
jgi:magnesium transporter